MFKRIFLVFIFLLAVLILILIGSLTVVVVFHTVDFIKNLIDDWR